MFRLLQSNQRTMEQQKIDEISIREVKVNKIIVSTLPSDRFFIRMNDHRTRRECCTLHRDSRRTLIRVCFKRSSMGDLIEVFLQTGPITRHPIHIRLLIKYSKMVEIDINSCGKRCFVIYLLLFYDLVALSKSVEICNF